MADEQLDPISPRGAAADVLVSLILLVGALCIEWLKTFFPTGDAPTLLIVILNLGELTLAVHFFRSLFRALVSLYIEFSQFSKLLNQSSLSKAAKLITQLAHLSRNSLKSSLVSTGISLFSSLMIVCISIFVLIIVVIPIKWLIIAICPSTIIISILMGLLSYSYSSSRLEDERYYLWKSSRSRIREPKRELDGIFEPSLTDNDATYDALWGKLDNSKGAYNAGYFAGKDSNLWETYDNSKRHGYNDGPFHKIDDSSFDKKWLSFIILIISVAVYLQVTNQVGVVYDILKFLLLRN